MSGRPRSVAKAIRRGKRAAGYLLFILGGISLTISVVLAVIWNAVGAIMLVAGLLLLFGWLSLLFGWVLSRKPHSDRSPTNSHRASAAGEGDLDS